MGLRERWSILPSGGEPDNAQGSPSSPKFTLLHLLLSPFNSRDIDDRFEIVFRVRIEEVNGHWVPWTKPAPFTKRERAIISRSRSPAQDIKHEAEKRSRSPFVKREPDSPQVKLTFLSQRLLALTSQYTPTQYTLSHRQRKNYGQTHAKGGFASGENML